MNEIVLNIPNCHECPFANNDNEYGYDGCNLFNFSMSKWEVLPENKRHDECKLPSDNIIITKKP